MDNYLTTPPAGLPNSKHEVMTRLHTTIKHIRNASCTLCGPDAIEV